MENLLLNSLEIRNFRAFRHLMIRHFGRVNLIVGKNNIGKSSVLEALWLYARKGVPLAVREILEARDESRLPTSVEATDLESQALAIKYLFHGRQEIVRESATISIGPIASPEATLRIFVAWYKQQISEDNVLRLISMLPEDYEVVENPVLGLVSQFGSQRSAVRRISRYFEHRLPPLTESNEIPNIFVPANGPTKNQVSFWRDRSVIEGRENYILNALRIIAPDVESINLVSSQEFGRAVNPISMDRIPVVKMKGIDTFIPLRSLGEGMNRLFGTTLALVNAENGILLIDEIESGVHYSVQPDMWRLIFQIAKILNVQVFATTHSKDCIDSFNKAAREDKEEDGLLIRLGRKQGTVVTTIFDEDELEIATEQNIEVR